MKTSPARALFAPLMVVLVAGLSGCGCGSDTGSTSGTGTAADSTGTMNNASATGRNASDPGAVGTNGDASGTGANGSTITMTEEQRNAANMERTGASSHLGGMRAMLMAELEAVRTRLNDGTRSKSAEMADKQRAAELAQGLERLDRALAAVNASNDTTWAAIRSSSLQEVDDIKVWMADRGMKSKS